MSKNEAFASRPGPAMLLAGLLYREQSAFESAKGKLISKFGPILQETEGYEWHCRHYEDELGWPVTRKFLFFERLVPPEDLPSIKQATNAMETVLSKNGKRAVNIDPGYLTLANLVLASTKGYGHRIYMGGGIHAEVTLLYSKKEGRYIPQMFTYRDFADEGNIMVFTEMRGKLKRKLAAG
ncbi:MAG: DUF4416 family protein [Actinomycetota bacterium]|nr:DUF4416 family protein [Actinomycetota bacterium]